VEFMVVASDEALKPISDDEANIASAKLKQMIVDAPADLKKRYIRAFVSEIVVGKSEIVITGIKRCARRSRFR